MSSRLAPYRYVVDVILEIDGNSSIRHRVSLNFTPDLVIADEAVELGVPAYELNLSTGVRGIDIAAGVVGQFEAAALKTPRPDPADWRCWAELRVSLALRSRRIRRSTKSPHSSRPARRHLMPLRARSTFFR